MEHPDETAEKKSSLHNIQEDSSVKNKINSTLNTNDLKKIKILNFRKSVIGSFSQSSSIFHGLGVGLQCVPNSIISLVYNKYKSCSSWSTQDLDEILKMGNILYNSIGKQTTLLVSEIPRYIKLYETIYFLEHGKSFIGYIFEDRFEINSVKFSKLNEIFHKFHYFVLILNDSCISIINIKNSLCVFDPHSRDTEGFPSSSGTSIFLEFPAFVNFCTYIEKFAKQNNCKMYELTPILITKFKEIENKKIIEPERQNIKNKIETNQPKKRKRNNDDEIISKKKKRKTDIKLPIKTIILKDNKLAKKLGYNLKCLQITIERTEKCGQYLSNNEFMKKNNCPCNEKIIKDALLAKKKGYNLPILTVNLKRIKTKSKQSQIKEIDVKMSKKQKENYGSSLKESIKIFNKLTTNGPIYVCSICQQINFLHNVSKIQNLKKHKNDTLLEKCNTHYKSINNIEYICNTCKKYIYKGKVPKLSIENGCGFHNKPDILNLFCLEERFISPVMAFMLIHQLFPGGQFSLNGGICHLPIEILKIVNTLPHNYSEFETIGVKLKCRLCYKNSVFNENVHPQKIIEALKYLMNTSDLYKEHNINIDSQWLQSFNNINTTESNKQELRNKIKSDSNIQNSSSDED